MDVASRVQHRSRPSHLYLDREKAAMPEDSGTESESYVRRKFQRTANDINANNANNANNDSTFRKPSMPASASRGSTDQSRPAFTHHRRRSTLRENARVPSGPREFPSPGKRSFSGSISSLTPALSETSDNASRSYLPQSTSESFFSRSNDPLRSSFVNSSSQVNLKPLEQTGTDFDFIPTVNFDDLHNSIANYDPNTPLLSDFPAVGGRRAFEQPTSGTNAKESTAWSSRPPLPKMGPREETELSRTSSFRRRLSAVAGGKQGGGQLGGKDVGAMPGQTGPLSLRGRRQSTAPHGPPPSGPAPPPVGAGSRAPRKSIGPGVLTGMMDGRKSSQPLVNQSGDQNLRSGMARSDSISKVSRRTTMQPPVSGTTDFSRTSTATATTQSRANKVKSMQAPPREPEPGTPSSRAVSKNTQHRAHTPSSSGNKRQSTVSGRASGLGARTISPTDARRLKRMSMMQAPPLPSKTVLINAQDEMPPFKLELPRLAQPSPSLIPRRTSGTTPSSARASPEGRHWNNGGVSLNSKSSYQSLLPSSASTSRLPTPKPRNVNSSSGQYGEDEETVPPVPAIPKAYESPRENELPFFSGSLRSSHPGLTNDDLNTSEFESDVSFLIEDAKSNAQAVQRARRNVSVDMTKTHLRTSTIDNIERSVNMAAPKQQWQQSDATGRKNNLLQPLRLPPLNLLPIKQRNGSIDALGATRQDLQPESNDQGTAAATPEPKRNAKTPSTPMTASKATFFRRQDDQKNLRSSTSHFALRDLVDDSRGDSQYLDRTDMDFMSLGLPIPNAKQRNAITPFSSGSLPKVSGEFSKHRSRPSGDYGDDFEINNFESFQAQSGTTQGPRSSRSGTTASYKTTDTQFSAENAAAESEQAEQKKESSSGGLRRKLSLSWRRSSSKASNHPDHKSSPKQETSSADKEHAKLQKRANQMLPPKLPASAMWMGDVPEMPSSKPRPSLDASTRPAVPAAQTLSASPNTASAEQAPSSAKTKSVHTEHPQPVSMTNRSSSWGSIPPNPRAPLPKAQANGLKSRQASAPSLSALVKDKDDFAADDEMRRLSQKRRDVDTAAKETEELRKRAVARIAMSPDQVLHDRNCTLNIFERGEIVDYAKDGIFFTGAKNARKIIGSLTPSPQTSEKDSKGGNYGYDDERGDYNIILGDHLAYRYEVVDILGKGSFGQVVRCVDHKHGGIVAVKIIRNKKRFHQQALVEVGILGRLRDWDPDGAHATLSITSSFYFRSHLCIVTPCLSINLYELIRAHNFVGFSLPLIRRFARQLLSCLVLLQHKRIIHCDLKPENILLCEARKADVRVIDFGSSCKEEEKVYTYIQSRFYRSPEVILGSSYGLGIDMWSFGCILAELWTGYPLFPGENEQEQLACIMEIFGPPDRHLVERCTRKKLFFDSVGKPRVTISSKGRRRRPSSKTLSQTLKCEDEAFLDFITRCLRWDPERRMKPHDAVSHAFITNSPLNQRPGIPDEARRAARLRNTAAVPAANSNVSSPVKRVQTQPGGAASSSAAVTQQTPVKEKSRPLPETPQTAVRTGPSLASNAQGNQASPSKQNAPPRRQSTMASINSAAVAGSKRASNGVPVQGNVASTPAQRQGSNNALNLAQMAAREANAARWRA